MAAARQLLVAALLSGDDSASSNASPSTTGQPPLVTTDHAQALLEAVFSASPDHASSSGGVGSDSSYDTDLLQVAERAGKLLLQTTTSTSTTKRALNVQSACSMIQLVIRARPNLCCARYAAWCTAVLPMLTRNNPTSSVPSITDTLILLFEACVSRQDLVRDVVAVHLPKFIQALLDHARTPLAVSAAMRMTHAFSSIVKPLAGKLQKWAGEGLVELGDITDVEGADQTEALRCGALLMELVNCSGKQACEAAFAKRVLRLVVTVHELLDQLYAAVDEELFKRPVDETAINIPKLSRDYLESTPALLTLYRRIMGVTVAALNRTYIGPVGVPLQELVDLLQRVFHLNRFCVQKYGEDQTQFTLSMLITGETMRPACDLLATLCATFGQHMMRYRSPVTGMLMSALNASSSPSHPDGTTTSSVGDNALRIATYRATSSAIASLGPTFVRAVQQALMGAVLGDVTGDPLACMLDETIQQSVEQTSGSRGAGRKRKHQQSTTSSSFVSMNGSTASAASAPLDVKIAALQVAQSALDCGASMLNVSLRNKLDRLVIKALLLEESRAISPFYVSSHASAAALHLTIYRAHLYETLLASVSAPAFASPTVLPLALHAFATGTQDGALMVRAVSHRAMVYCDALLKPRLPPLMRRATLRKYLAQVEREEEREAEEEVEAEENKTLHVETEDVETMTEDVAVEMRGQVAMAPISAKSVSAPAAVDIDTLISSSPVKKARQEEPRATSITVPIVEPPQMDTNLVEEPVVETQQMGVCLAKESADAPTIEPKRELPDSEQEAADEELDDLDDFEIVDAAPDAA